MSELPSGTQPQAQDDDTSENKRHPDSTVSEQSLAASSSPESPSSSAAGGDQAPRPDSVQVPGSTTKRRVDLTRKSGRFLRAYLRSIVLLVTAIIAGIAAFVCFPKDGPVAPSNGIHLVSINTPFAPYTVLVSLTDDHSRNGIIVFAQVTSTTPPSARAVLNITVPDTTWGGVNKCGPSPARCITFNGVKIVSLGFGKSTKFSPAGRAYYKEEVREFIPDVGSSTAWNSEYVSAVLPNVGVYLMQAGNFIHEDVPTTISVWIPDASRYTWTSGAAPVVAGSYAAWEFASPPGIAQVNNGISLPAQDSATKLIFVAGALLGIAGGALIGAIQEAVKSN